MESNSNEFYPESFFEFSFSDDDDFDDDAELSESEINKLPKTRRAYRRYMTRKKEARLRKIVTNSNYCPTVGYVDWEIIDGEVVETGLYVKRSSNSRQQKWEKRLSSKITRKQYLPRKGNAYRRYYDYWWTLY